MATCPYCKAKMDEPPPSKKMTVQQALVYEAILNAGPDGLAAKSIMLGFFNEKSPVTLRTCIHHINKIIHPERIRGKRKMYFLTS